MRGVTIFDGEGGRIDNGSIVMTSGKVDRIGGPDMDLPTDADVMHNHTPEFENDQWYNWNGHLTI